MAFSQDSQCLIQPRPPIRLAGLLGVEMMGVLTPTLRLKALNDPKSRSYKGL